MSTEMKKTEVSFQPWSAAIKLKYVVIVVTDGRRILWVRHRQRGTWEIPGGHIEPGETCDEAARRELWEETGITKADLKPLSIYTVTQNGKSDSGMLYLTDSGRHGPLPAFEIAETRWFAELPEALTYPAIQQLLLKRALQSRQMQRSQAAASACSTGFSDSKEDEESDCIDH